MQEEKLALEAQNVSLQMLVSELLLTNHQLRLEIVQLKQWFEAGSPSVAQRKVLEVESNERRTLKS